MSCSVKQTRRFARQYKKLHNAIATDVDSTVAIIASEPGIGEGKKGDLAKLLVYKFHSQDQLYLLGYTLDAEVRLIYLEAAGPHENFYRDLKRH